MKKKRIILFLISVGILYLTGYAVSRIKQELVHRETWDGGWNRHWIIIAEPGPSMSHWVFMTEDQAAKDRYKSEYQAISRRRKVFGILFLPARCLESLAWWMTNPRDRELSLQTVPGMTKGTDNS